MGFLIDFSIFPPAPLNSSPRLRECPEAENFGLDRVVASSSRRRILQSKSRRLRERLATRSRPLLLSLRETQPACWSASPDLNSRARA